MRSMSSAAVRGGSYAPSASRRVGTRARRHAPRAAAPPARVSANGTTAAADVTQGEESESSFTLRCPHFDECPGCSMETELDAPPTLARARAFFAERGVADFTALTGEVHGWRNRAKLAARRGRCFSVYILEPKCPCTPSPPAPLPTRANSTIQAGRSVYRWTHVCGA
jgi:hypothetical protein